MKAADILYRVFSKHIWHNYRLRGANRRFGRVMSKKYKPIN